MKQDDNTISGLFPCPVYMIKRADIIIPKETMEIENIIRKGMHDNVGNSSTNDSYIFDTKLQELKEFCNRHVKKYVEQIIDPKKEELDFYITQSWLNVTKPGGFHHEHSHQNSIISGVFYISTVEDDRITFNDPNGKVKAQIKFEPKEFSIWNSTIWHLPVTNNELILFPSWLNHSVVPNKKATTDRISISFNVFARGVFGDKESSNELIL